MLSTAIRLLNSTSSRYGWELPAPSVATHEIYPLRIRQRNQKLSLEVFAEVLETGTFYGKEIASLNLSRISDPRMRRIQFTKLLRKTCYAVGYFEDYPGNCVSKADVDQIVIYASKAVDRRYKEYVDRELSRRSAYIR